MNFDLKLESSGKLLNLELMAQQIVEGFNSGYHKSPFHGFSSEFEEHKIYNFGESTKHIDWKLFARSDKLYTKRFDDDTNLRCHFIIDNSASMHFPTVTTKDLKTVNKLRFSVLSVASLMQVLKKQRDAIGLSVFGTDYESFFTERGNSKHYYTLMSTLTKLYLGTPQKGQTNTYKYLHEISDKIHKRSLIVLFTDMFQSAVEDEKLFDAVRHLKFNKHEVIIFHVYDSKTEFNFEFINRPTKFIDTETGDSVDIFPNQIQKKYTQKTKDYFRKIKLKCSQYKINYVQSDVNEGFDNILKSLLISRQKIK